MHRHLLAALPFLLCAACGASPWSMENFKEPRHGGLKRASFEMECPENELKAVDLDGGRGTVGVTGCGKKAVYKWAYGAGWVNNSGGGDDEKKK